MIATGIAASYQEIGEDSFIPSKEIIYLAYHNLRKYRITHLFNGMRPGWDFALAMGAVKADIPISAYIPRLGFEKKWDLEIRSQYYKTIMHARYIEPFTREPDILPRQKEITSWMIERSDVLLVLWRYEFDSLTYQMMQFATKKGVQVVNLWEDLRKLREKTHILVSRQLV
ncbi:MAG: hypothetical protein ACM3PY_20990 [Omnitrophica WOR_2 bacterium]